MNKNWQVPVIGRLRFRLRDWSTAVASVCVLALSTLMFAAPPPVWWSARGATSTQPTNDSAAINQGQLKHFTQKAVDEMNARFPGGAGTELNAIVQGWEEDYATNGYSPTNPNPADFHAITIGQLKWVAQKIHARLLHFRWQDELPVWLVLNPASDNQLANIGQLKTVFAFDLTAPAGQLPLWWQKYYFDGQVGINPLADYDDDGLADLQEYQQGTNPASADSDGDGVMDGEEVNSIYTNPLAAIDADGDGLADDWEKWWARQIIASGIALSPSQLTALLAGNIDPADEPFGDGTTNAEQSEVSKQTAAIGRPASPYRSYIKSRAVWGDILANPGPNTVIGGVYSTLGGSSLPAGWFTPSASQIESELATRAPWANLPWEDYPVISGFSQMQKETYSDGRLRTEFTVDQRKLKVIYPAVSNEARTVNFLKITTTWGYPVNGGNPPSEAVERVQLTVPANRTTSEEIEIKATLAPGADQKIEFVPVEAAPEILAVNSDFDEGRIDPATGYAIPDCDDMPGVDLKTGAGNTKLELGAERNHLDGKFTQGQHVVDDLHQGWFGVNPNQLSDDFCDGANVTIRKIDKIDSETGYKESGQVRFYAKWAGGHYGIMPYDLQTLQPVNLVSAGINLRPGEGVYGESSTIPDAAKFYMEGVRPGKITLEWRYQKGTIDVKYEQTFKVETRKTVAEWQDEVRYQIRLQTKVKSGTQVDVALYHPGNGFRNANAGLDNVLRVNAIYEYYQQLYKQMPEKFMWAGMAKVAAAPIYAGMSDLHTWWVNSGWFPRPEPRGFLDPGIQIFIKGLLLGGQKNIFTDKAWAHRAYKASGIGALNYLSQDFPDATNFEAWKLMDEGIFANDPNKIFEANGRLLRREQQEVVQQNYDIIQNLWIYQPPAHPNINGGVWVAVNSEGLSNAGEWLSANSNNNPLPGGPGFRATFPGGRLDFFNDRWAWTTNAASGMLEIWTGASTSAPGYNAGRRASENGKTIKAAATNYSYDPAGIP